MPVSNTFKHITFRVRKIIGHYPHLYYPLRRILNGKSKLAVQHDTEIVIEGYPRSGNSFSVVAFEHAQKRHVKIAHHLHNPSQIIKGAKLGIPIIVLLRDPISAVCSFVIRESQLTIDDALWDYIDFHKHILPFRQKFLIAMFEEVTSNYSNVITQLNRKYSTNFDIFEHSDANVAKVFSQLDSLESSSDAGNIDENKVARPSKYRANQAAEIQSKLLSKEYSVRLATAQSLYAILADKR